MTPNPKRLPEPLQAALERLDAKCSVCGAACINMRINNAHLCDTHFDAWLSFDRGPAAGGGLVRMAAFLNACAGAEEFS